MRAYRTSQNSKVIYLGINEFWTLKFLLIIYYNYYYCYLEGGVAKYIIYAHTYPIF